MSLAFCTKCKEEKEVKSASGRLVQLVCGHLIARKFEEEIKEETRIAEVEKELPTIPVVFDESKFHNKKTKDVPYPFQDLGIKFAIEHAFKVLIADEQGLGKTVQAIGVLHYAMQHCYDEVFPVLILSPSNIKIQWMVNLMNWGGLEFIPQIIEDGKTRPVLGFNIYIASYDILRRFSTKTNITLTSKYGHEIETTKKENPFYDFPFKTVIMDEVQKIKGESQRTEEVKRIAKNKNIIALSGTPIKNSAAEYYTILHLLAPLKFPSKERYLRNWVKTELINGYEKYTGLYNPERFAEFTSDMIIRRTREQVKDEIGLRVTKANRIFYHVDFENEKLKAAYLAAEAEFIRQMEEETRKKDPVVLIARLAVMRHLVGLNKIQPTVDLATEFLLENPSGKLVIFTQHTDVQDAIAVLLASWCKDGGYDMPLKFHSGLGAQERFDIVAKYADNKKIPFIIGSTLAMGEGVDRLQEVCNDCIIAERQWNPANEEQAESRLVRIGQTKGFVNATYPIASGTIDEYFTEIVEFKRRAMKETLDGVAAEWDETGLLSALYEAITSKGRKKPIKGW